MGIVESVVGFLREALSRFGWAYGYRGSLYLIAGGVFVLGVLVLVLLVHSTLFGTPIAAPPAVRRVLVAAPRAPPPLPPERAQAIASEVERGPDRAYRLGEIAGGAARARVLDDVLDAFVAAGLGDPRIVATRSDLKRLHVPSCRSCSSVPRAGRTVCEYERGFLAGGFARLVGTPRRHEAGVRVRETACRARGDDGCVFEVSY